MAIMPAKPMRSTASKEVLMTGHLENISALITLAIQGASQGLSTPHCRVRGDKPVAVAIENACLFFDRLVGGLPAWLRFFLCVPNNWSNGTAQGERHQRAKSDVREIQADLPLACFLGFAGCRSGSCLVCAGSLGGFCEKEFWMWR